MSDLLSKNAAAYELFGRKVFAKLTEDWEIGVGDWEANVLLADMAVECSLMQMVKYDPDKHGEIDADPGVEIHYWGDNP